MIHLLKGFVSAVRTFAIATTSFALALGIAEFAQAQQYGPRIFWVAPSGLHPVQLQLLHQETNTAIDSSIVYSDLDIDTTALIGSYAPTLSLGDLSGQFVISLPYASSEVQVSTASRESERSNSGLADMYTEFRIGLVNAPGLNLQEFLQYMAEENPQVQVRALVGVFVPTGEYDSDRVVNIGSNRWAFRVGIPVIIRLSENWKPGNRTTLELVPVTDFYTDNNSPSLSNNERIGQFVADRTAQNPLFRIEAHLTHDLTDKVWVSLDSYYVFGGATYADGVGQDNQQSWLGLGGTLGSNPWPGGTLSVNGGGVVARNDNSPDGWQVRLMVIQAF